MKKALLATSFLLTAACGAGGSGGSKGSGSISPITTAPTGSSTTPGQTTPPVATQKGYDGVWDVAGTDPVRGAFTGTAEIAASASGGYTVKRLVAYTAKLSSGEQVLAAWNATAKEDQGGLRVEATLRRAHVFKRAGTVTRTAADQQPLALSTLLLAPSGGPVGGVSQGTQMAGTFAATGGTGPTETWTRSSTAAPTFPVANEKTINAHSPAASSVKSTMFLTYSSFHALPAVKPYVARPEFQAAIHQVILDSSYQSFYRQRGPGVIVVVDKIADEVAVAEEGQRAHAFTRKLVDKAKLFDADLKTTTADPNGMVTAVDHTVTPARRDFSLSPVLYTGVWGASQYYRYKVTNEQEALDNVVRAITGAVLCVDVPPVKTEFARAVDFLVNAQPGQVGPGGKYSWEAGTGQYANLMWMRGGNNDMLHGVEICFAIGADVLPAGHPLRAQIGNAAASLLTNVKDAQDGNHEILLAYAAAKTTGSAVWQKRYKDSLGFKNILQKVYLTAGGNLTHYQGTADWSGHHLGCLTLLGVDLLGGAAPNSDEKSWRDAAAQGVRQGFDMTGLYREGLVAVIAAAAKAPGASDIAKGVLTEIPYPKAYGDVDVDYTISLDFCLSPYPTAPWKFDWTTNPDRIQSLRSYPYFYRGSQTNFWNRSPLSFTGGPDKSEQPGQDYLVGYWLARHAGLIGAAD